MKSIIALGVGLVVALAPGGTAFAGTVDNATGGGNAWGNCKHSSANGVIDPRMADGAGKGNGGHVTAAKAAKVGEGCVAATPPQQPAAPDTGVIVGPPVDETGSGGVQ